MMRLIVLVSLVAIAACTPQPATYAPDVERNFMVACEAQGSTNALCSCTWDKIEAEVPPGDFAALERLPALEREANSLTAQINGYVETCNASLTPQVEPGAEEVAPEP